MNEKNVNLQMTYYSMLFINSLSKKLIHTENGQSELLLEQLDLISLLNYEGSSAKAKILFINSNLFKKNVEFKIELKTKIQLSEYRKVRKLMELTGENLYLISNGRYIYGLGHLKNFNIAKDHSVSNQSFMVEFSGLGIYKISILDFVDTRIPNSESIKWDIKERVILLINNKQISLENRDFPKIELRKTLTNEFDSYFNDNKLKDLKLENTIKIVEEASKQACGTMVVITTPLIAEKEISRLSEQGIPIGKIQFENKDKNSLIQNLTSIDGAIYLDCENNCYAIGVILDGIVIENIGNSSRGARYNSALRYYNSQELKGKCVIVVISEDGMVDIIPNDKQNKQFLSKEVNKLQLFIQERKYEEVLNKIDKLLIENKNYGDFYRLKAITYLRQGKFNDALSVLNEVDRIEPNNSMTFSIFGNIYYNSGYFEKAIYYYSKAIELSPNTINNYLLRALAYTKDLKINEARSDFEKARELDPSNDLVDYRLGRMYDELKQYEQAITSYTQAIELAPNDRDNYLARARAYIHNSQIEEARSDFEKARELDPSDDLVDYGLGRMYDELKQYEQAITSYTQAIELAPNNRNNYLARARAYIHNSQIEEARSDFEKARELDPSDDLVDYGLGRMYDELKQYEQAITSYTQAIELAPNDRDNYLARARAYIHNSQIEEARSDFEKARELDPSNDLVDYGLGEMYEELKQYEMKNEK